MASNNVKEIPNQERDEMLAAQLKLMRMAPDIARTAHVLFKSFKEAGFTEDQSLKLVAYAMFGSHGKQQG